MTSPILTNRSEKVKWAWSFFDFSNSGFFAVVSTFVFAAYFTNSIAPTMEIGTSLWGIVIGVSGILIAILSPISGAASKHRGGSKPWLIGFTLIGIVSTASLWFAKPDQTYLTFAMITVIIATVAFETGCVFYNSMLPYIAEKNEIGKLSGRAWCLGYIGGVLCLILCLVAFIQAEPPPFNLAIEEQEHIRATMVLTSLWVAVFACPLFLLVPNNAVKKLTIADTIKQSIIDVRSVFQSSKPNQNILKFLVARMIYIDGVNTMFAFGGIYASGTFNMNMKEIMFLGIGLNLSAGIGALIFGWLDDKKGSKLTLNISLLSLMLATVAVLISQSVTQFWISAIIMSLFFGPIQSSSRTFMARLAPANLRNSLFGLYTMSGKVTTFAGPFLVAIFVTLANSQRLGLAVVLVFLVLGFIILQTVTDTVYEDPKN
ncbi:MAG: MFS transporter [Rhodospirillaceae bacterium]|nr:MFS transporter [Rhodospirillaceae bacterium]